jgi:hypothetical protein
VSMKFLVPILNPALIVGKRFSVNITVDILPGLIPVEVGGVK